MGYDVTQDLNTIREAILGQDMRGAIANAVEGLDSNIKENQENDSSKINDISGGIIQNIFGYISGNVLTVNYYGYSNDNIDLRTLTADVTSINDSLVYLYQDTSNNWAISFEAPSSYNLAPALIGKVKSYWIGNGAVKHFYPLNTVDICHDFYANFSQIYATKQNAEPGKGLSTNDFTNELKATLENIACEFITNTVNNLTNYYLKSETYSKSEVNQLIGAIPKFKIEVVNQLPTTDISTATVYLVTTGAESQNLYTEYIYVNNAWEKLGTQTVDLTGYATQTWVSSYIQSAFNSTLSNFYNKQEADTALGNKVDKSDAVFNIRGYIDYDEHPYLYLWFSRYINGNLIERPLVEDVFNITNSSVYLYRNTSNQWTLGFTSPSSGTYNGTPMLVGNIATKTVGGESVKLFFRNGDDETQFDKLNSEKVDKVTGKGLSTNDFTNEYKSKIETNEYNDIFNIRVEWDRQYMPHAELIAISFQYYENGILVNNVAKHDVKDITNGNVYLYKDIRNLWEIAVGTEPSSYDRLPMLVGKIATKTVNGALKKYFVRNDEENLFDDLNENKVDKETWELIDTVTIEEEVSAINKNVDSDGNALKLKAIKILALLGSSSTSTAELIINACSDNNYSSTVGLCTERLALSGARFNYVAKQQNGYWNAEWSGRKATTNYKGGYFLEPAFSTLSVTSKPYIRSWKIRTPTSGVTFSTSTTIEIWGIRGE